MAAPRALIHNQTDSNSPAELLPQAIETEAAVPPGWHRSFVEQIVRKLGGNLDTTVAPSTSQEDEAAQDHHAAPVRTAAGNSLTPLHPLPPRGCPLNVLPPLREDTGFYS